MLHRFFTSKDDEWLYPIIKENGRSLTTDWWTSLTIENKSIYAALYITKQREFKSRILSIRCSEEKDAQQKTYLRI